MTDGIIKGTGNSRFLKSVANAMTLYPTHEALMEALVSGTFPIDLNGINPAGWDVVGNKLDKATLLTDALCTALGLAATATPTQAMDKLRQLVATAQTGVDNGVKTQIVSYVGTGKYGQANPCSVTFDFAPKVALMLGYIYFETNRFSQLLTHPVYYRASIMISNLLTTTLGDNALGFCNSAEYSFGGSKSADGKTFYWYESKSVNGQLNLSGSRYYVFGIG